MRRALAALVNGRLADAQDRTALAGREARRSQELQALGGAAGQFSRAARIHGPGGVLRVGANEHRGQTQQLGGVVVARRRTQHLDAAPKLVREGHPGRRPHLGGNNDLLGRRGPGEPVESLRQSALLERRAQAAQAETMHGRAQPVRAAGLSDGAAPARDGLRERCEGVLRDVLRIHIGQVERTQSPRGHAARHAGQGRPVEGPTRSPPANPAPVVRSMTCSTLLAPVPPGQTA